MATMSAMRAEERDGTEREPSMEAASGGAAPKGDDNSCLQNRGATFYTSGPVRLWWGGVHAQAPGCGSGRPASLAAPNVVHRRRCTNPARRGASRRKSGLGRVKL